MGLCWFETRVGKSRCSWDWNPSLTAELNPFCIPMSWGWGAVETSFLAGSCQHTIPNFRGHFYGLQLQDPKGHSNKAQGTPVLSQSPLERAGGADSVLPSQGALSLPLHSAEPASDPADDSED